MGKRKPCQGSLAGFTGFIPWEFQETPEPAGDGRRFASPDATYFCRQAKGRYSLAAGERYRPPLWGRHPPPIFFSSCRKENGPWTVQKKRALFLTNRDRLGRSTGLSGAFALPATVPSSFRASTRWCGGRRSPGSSTALGDTARKRRRFRRPQRLPQAPGQRQRLSAQRRFDNLRRLVSASCRSLVSALRRKRAPSAALPLPTKSPILRGPLMPSFPHGSPRNILGVLRG